MAAKKFAKGAPGKKAASKSAKKVAAKKPAAKRSKERLAEMDAFSAERLALLDRWKVVYDSLHARPEVEVVSATGDPADRVDKMKPQIVEYYLYDELGELSRMLGVAARTAIGAFVCAHDHFAWRLEVKGSMNEGGGEVRWTAPREWTKPFASAPEWAIFDDSPTAGSGAVGLVRIEDGVLRFAHFDDELVPMDIGLHGYVDAVYALRGWYGWRLLYCDVDFRSIRWRVAAEAIGRGLDRLPGLFPDLVIAPYRERFRARHGEEALAALAADQRENEEAE